MNPLSSNLATQPLVIHNGMWTYLTVRYQAVCMWPRRLRVSPQSMRRQTEMELKMFKQNEEVYRTMREAALKKQPAKAMAENSSTEEKIEDVSRKQ